MMSDNVEAALPDTYSYNTCPIINFSLFIIISLFFQKK